jgi:hypothetical protein
MENRIYKKMIWGTSISGNLHFRWQGTVGLNSQPPWFCAKVLLETLQYPGNSPKVPKVNGDMMFQGFQQNKQQM